MYCHVLIFYAYIFFGSVSMQMAGQFGSQLLSFKSPLCILDGSPVLTMFYKHFPPSCGLSSHSSDRLFHRTVY